MLKIRKWLNRQGFTLIELLVVLAIIGIIAALAVPKLTGVVSDAKAETCKANIKTIENAVKVYETRFGKTPSEGDVKAYYFGDSETWPVCPDEGIYSISGEGAVSCNKHN